MGNALPHGKLKVIAWWSWNLCQLEKENIIGIAQANKKPFRVNLHFKKKKLSLIFTFLLLFLQKMSFYCFIIFLTIENSFYIWMRRDSKEMKVDDCVSLEQFPMLFLLLRNHQNICIFTRLISITTLRGQKYQRAMIIIKALSGVIQPQKDGSDRKKISYIN